MSDPNPNATTAPRRERYEAPRVLEDLPLESFSLACDPGKNEGQCDLDGLPLST